MKLLKSLVPQRGPGHTDKSISDKIVAVLSIPQEYNICKAVPNYPTTDSNFIKDTDKVYFYIMLVYICIYFQCKNQWDLRNILLLASI